MGHAQFAFFDEIGGLSVDSFDSPFEDGGSLLSEFKVDDVGAGLVGHDLLIESDDFEFGAAGEEFGLCFFAMFFYGGLFVLFGLDGVAACFGLFLWGSHIRNKI